MLISQIKTILTGFFLLHAISLSAQTLSIKPHQPAWGDTLSITYKLAMADSTVNPIYFLVYLYDENDHLRRIDLPARPCKNGYYTQFGVDDSSSFFELFITDKTKQIVDTTFKYLIYNRSGKVAKNGYANLAVFYDNEERKTLLDKELKLYPDNYKEYQAYWSTLARIHILDNFSLMDTVSKALDVIAHKKPSASPNLLYLMAHANLILGKRAQYLSYLNELVLDYPTSIITGKFLNLFKIFEEHRNTETKVIPNARKSNEVGKPGLNFHDIYSSWENIILKRFPLSDRAFSIAVGKTDDKNISFQALEKIFKHKITKDPNGPIPYYYLAKLYANRQHDYKKAQKYIEQTLGIYTSCNKPFYFSVYSTRYQEEFLQNARHLRDYIITIKTTRY